MSRPLFEGKSPEETVRLAAMAAMLDPQGFLAELGRRLASERSRGRTEGIGLALFTVLLVGWLSGRSTGWVAAFLTIAAIVTYAWGWWLGRREWRS